MSGRSALVRSVLPLYSPTETDATHLTRLCVSSVRPAAGMTRPCTFVKGCTPLWPPRCVFLPLSSRLRLTERGLSIPWCSIYRHYGWAGYAVPRPGSPLGAWDSKLYHGHGLLDFAHRCPSWRPMYTVHTHTARYTGPSARRQGYLSGLGSSPRIGDGAHRSFVPAPQHSHEQLCLVHISTSGDPSESTLRPWSAQHAHTGPYDDKIYCILIDTRTPTTRLRRRSTGVTREYPRVAQTRKCGSSDCARAPWV